MVVVSWVLRRRQGLASGSGQPALERSILVLLVLLHSFALSLSFYFKKKIHYFLTFQHSDFMATTISKNLAVFFFFLRDRFLKQCFSSLGLS